MSSRNTGEEARRRIAEEESEIDVSVDYERLARLVAANPPPAIEDSRRAEAEAQRRLDEVRRRAEAERLDKRLGLVGADIPGDEPVLLPQPPPQSPRDFYQAAPSPYPSAIQKKSSMPSMLITAMLCVVVLGGGMSAYFLLLSRDTSGDQVVENPQGGPVIIKNGTESVITKQETIAIPGGSFQMGRNDGPPAEAPAHSVTVSDFSMDKTEVTNAEYAEFVNETK
ncbi:MAG TPA: SUMF1/EgtB/PvdO family nonheme iron enzyme, partial [Pyrinomonadaceae bacterium]